MSVQARPGCVPGQGILSNTLCSCSGGQPKGFTLQKNMEGEALRLWAFCAVSFWWHPRPDPFLRLPSHTHNRSQGISTQEVLAAVADQQPCSRVFVLSGAAHADVELVSSLTEKISLLEQQVEKQAQEIQLKVKGSLLPSLLCPLPQGFHLPDPVWAQLICGLLLITQRSPLQSDRAVGSGPGVAEGTVPAGAPYSSDSQHPGTNISSSLASEFIFSPPVVVHLPCCFLKQQLLTQQGHPGAALSD